MPEINPFKGPLVRTIDYPGQKQQEEDWCVYASVASAFHYLSGVRVEHATLPPLKPANENVNFQTVVSLMRKLDPLFIGIKGEVFHDKDNPLNDPEARVKKANVGDTVFIVSLQNAASNGKRVGSWHMLSAFRSQRGFEVWDTNGSSGSIQESELIAMLRDTGLNVLFPGNNRLVEHDRHECLILNK